MLLLIALLCTTNTPPPDRDDDRQVREERPAGHARTDDPEEEEEEAGRVDPDSSIVVTARRLDAARTRIDASLGATVYSLSNETIENRPGSETGSIAATLTQTPGVSLVGNALTIRGSRALQVRINNVIVPETIADPAEHLSSRLAETTRVMTGTLPAQFGFAPAGVISVTTKSGTYQHGGQLELFAATDGMVEPAVEWAGSIAGTTLFASGSLERERTRIADATGRSSTDLRHGLEGLVFADRLLNESDRISLILGGSRERHSIGATTLGAGTAMNENAYAVGSYQHSSGGFTVQASLFAAFSNDEARFTALSRERGTVFGTQIDAAQEVGSAHILRAGLLATRLVSNEFDTQGDRTRGRRTSPALYAQDEWKLTSTLTINPGMRIEWIRGPGAPAAVEPRISLIWTSATGLTAHLGYARYAATPPLGERLSGRLPDERDDYYDAGVQLRQGPFTFGIDAYSRSSRNFISEHEVPGEAVVRAFGFKKADFRGLEISVTYARGRLMAWGNLAVAQARGRSIVGSGRLFAPEILRAAESWVPLASERPVTGSGGLAWRLGDVSLSGDFLVSSGTGRSATSPSPNGSRSSPYALFDFAAVHHMRMFGHLTDLRLDLINLGGARYLTRDASGLEGGWTMRGRRRTLTVGIEQGF